MKRGRQGVPASIISATLGVLCLCFAPGLHAELPNDIFVYTPFTSFIRRPGVIAAASQTVAGDNAFEKYVLGHYQALNWEVLLRGPQRVFYVGDRHSFRSPRDELIRAMAAIRRAGITHLGLELWEDMQPLLDGPLDEGAPETSRLKAVLQRTRQPESWLALIRAARSAGLHLVALDMNQDGFHELKRRFPEDIRKVANYRDVNMAGHIHRLLQQDPTVRVLAIVGAGHIDKTDQPQLLRQTFGWDSRSFYFAGVGYYGETLKTLGLLNQRIVIPMPRDIVPFDVISIPEMHAETKDHPFW